MFRSPIKNYHVINQGPISWRQFRVLLETTDSIRLSQEVKDLISRQRKVVDEVVNQDIPAYGVNRGAASLRDNSVDPGFLSQDLLCSHAAGVGPALNINVVRSMQLAKLISWANGGSGISEHAMTNLLACINERIIPIIPRYSSPGAGSLGYGAHIGLTCAGHELINVVINKKEYEENSNNQNNNYYHHYQNDSFLSAKYALEQKNIKPMEYLPKVGMSFINGRQAMVGYVSELLYQINILTKFGFASKYLYLSSSNIHESTFHEIHHYGQRKQQQKIASFFKNRLYIQPSINNDNDQDVQNNLDIRCTAQILSPIITNLKQIEIEISECFHLISDNPVINENAKDKTQKYQKLISTGNFLVNELDSSIRMLSSIQETLADILVTEIINAQDEKYLLPPPRPLKKEEEEEPRGGHGFMIFPYVATSTRQYLLSLNTQLSQATFLGNGTEQISSFIENKCILLENRMECLKDIIAISLIVFAQRYALMHSSSSNHAMKNHYKKQKDTEDIFNMVNEWCHGAFPISNWNCSALPQTYISLVSNALAKELEKGGSSMRKEMHAIELLFEEEGSHRP